MAQREPAGEFRIGGLTPRRSPRSRLDRPAGLLMPRVVIVGGGISGLALAYRLQQRHASVEITILEERSRVGGTVCTDAADGFRVEEGPNGFLDTNPATRTLAEEVGLGPRLVAADEQAARQRFLVLGGRLRPLPTGLLSFLRSDLLSWRGKLGLLLERFRPPRRDGGDESIDAFARRRVGPEVADVLADAFVTGIYAGDPRLLSVQAAFPRLAALEREHGSILRGMARRKREGGPARRARGLWSFREGLGLLTETLRERLRRPPLVGAAARGLRRRDGTWTVRGDGDHWDAEAVVLACPARCQAELLAAVDPTLSAEVAAIPYSAVAVVAVGYRAADVPIDLRGFGYLSPQRERRDVLGVQWCSSIFPDRAPPGFVLLRALCGGWHRPDIVTWDDNRLLAAVRAELHQTMRIDADPVFHRIVRWPQAIPQYHLGHGERVARIEERTAAHPGLFLGGNAYRGVALNDCVEQAGVLAGRVIAWLNSPAP